MGFDCELEEKFHFIYKAEFDNGLTEWEFDRVFVGLYDGEVTPNPKELANMRWIAIDELKRKIEEKPEEFAEWFRIILSYYSSER